MNNSPVIESISIIRAREALRVARSLHDDGQITDEQLQEAEAEYQRVKDSLTADIPEWGKR